jgi:RimJ/RimL family protein N-acetyltransferase
VRALGLRGARFGRAEIVVETGNVASRRAAEKAGARFECVARNRLFKRGGWVDAAMYALVPEDVA